MQSQAVNPSPWPPKLLGQSRGRLRTLHYAIRTEDAYADWARRFIIFHGKRHPRELGATEVGAFLTGKRGKPRPSGRERIAWTPEVSFKAIAFVAA